MESGLSQPVHEMTVIATYETGAEDWYCETCGRRFLMVWPPEYKKVLLTRGDENAIHTGGKGGVSVGNVKIVSGESSTEDSGLLDWKEMLNDMDFDGLWNKDIDDSDKSDDDGTLLAE